MVEEYMNLKEARGYLGVSRVKMTKLVKDIPLQTIPDPLDSRSRLILKGDLEKLKLRGKPAPKVSRSERSGGNG